MREAYSIMEHTYLWLAQACHRDGDIIKRNYYIDKATYCCIMSSIPEDAILLAA